MDPKKLYSIVSTLCSKDSIWNQCIDRDLLSLMRRIFSPCHYAQQCCEGFRCKKMVGNFDFVLTIDYWSQCLLSTSAWCKCLLSVSLWCYGFIDMVHLNCEGYTLHEIVYFAKWRICMIISLIWWDYEKLFWFYDIENIVASVRGVFEQKMKLRINVTNWT